MPKPFARLTVDQFAERLRTFTFTRRITAVHMHHTFIPRQTDFRGEPTIDGMFRFHTQTNGWSDIAQHVSIAPDGSIWTGRDWNRTPASATGFNDGAFMFETIGNFDVGQERLEGAQRQAVIEVIARVQLKCGLPIESLHFHREFTDQKTCPGTGVRKPEILAEVRDARTRLTGGVRSFVAAPNATALPASRRFSVQAANTVGSTPSGTRGTLTQPFSDTELAKRGGDEGEVDCGRVGARDVSLDGVQARGFSPDDLAFLRRHVVNLRQGRFSGGGVFETAKADVDAMFAEHIPAALEESKRRGEKKLRLVVWAHGGLVDEESGLGMARAVIPWWLDNHVYPIYFVWETGLFETITQLIKGRRELAAARDIFDLTDRPIEELVRAVGGGKIWDGMKMSAQRSVEPDGGARYVAKKLGELCAANPNQLELHAVGHSAGAIFHSHFIPAALDLNAPPFETLGFLAPAIRVSEFETRVIPRLGKGINALTMYTMKKDLERDDNCATLYRKSLLYLIHAALEAKRDEPILGLEESIRENPALVKLFGIGGTRGAHEVLFSKTGESTGRSATRSTSHGGFDNDTATMESVLRRVLDVDDPTPIVLFPEQVARAFSFDTTLTKGDFAEAPAIAAPAPAPVPDRQPVRPSPTIPGGHPARLLRALCVGINAYPGDARLSGCVNDANDWGRLFKGLGFDRVDLLADHDATQERLRRELRDLVCSGGPGDVLVFQYSGHGTFFQDQSGPLSDEDDGRDEAIVPVDFDHGKFILDDELFAIFGELQDGAALTCFFDCCHSGSISRFVVTNLAREVRESRDDDVRARFIDPTPAMVAEYRAQRSAAGGRRARSLHASDDLKAVVFAACRDDEVALESAGHGKFTRLVTPMVAAAFDSATSNDDFQTQIAGAFGAGSSQNPALDCASGARGRPLFRIGGAPSTPSTPGFGQPDRPVRWPR